MSVRNSIFSFNLTSFIDRKERKLYENINFQVKFSMLKIVFTEAETPGVDRSSALVQHRTEGAEVMNLVRLDLICQDVAEARRTVPAQRRQEHH